MWEWTLTHYYDIGMGLSASELIEHPLRQHKSNGKTTQIQIPLFWTMLLYCYHLYFLENNY